MAEILRQHSGIIPLRIVLDLADGRRVLLDADRDRVAWSPELHAALSQLLGAGCLRAVVTLGNGVSNAKRRDAEASRRGPSSRKPAGAGR